MRNFDQEAKHIRDQLLETLKENTEYNDFIIHQITIKPKAFSIQFEDEDGDKIKYEFPIRMKK